MKVLALSLSVSLVLIGCGSSSNTSNKIVKNPTEIIVERGPVLGAFVSDKLGKKAVQKKEMNVYIFEDTPTYPIYSKGGYVDINKDGKLSKGDMELKNITLKSYSNIITPITTYIASYEDSLRDDKAKELAKKFKVNIDDLKDKVPTFVSKEAVVLANAIFKDSLDEKFNFNDISKNVEYINQMIDTSELSETTDIEDLALQLEKNLLNNDFSELYS